MALGTVLSLELGARALENAPSEGARTQISVPFGRATWVILSTMLVNGGLLGGAVYLLFRPTLETRLGGTGLIAASLGITSLITWGVHRLAGGRGTFVAAFLGQLGGLALAAITGAIGSVSVNATGRGTDTTTMIGSIFSLGALAAAGPVVGLEIANGFQPPQLEARSVVSLSAPTVTISPIAGGGMLMLGAAF